jgi:FkbM family methyltransferase
VTRNRPNRERSPSTLTLEMRDGTKVVVARSLASISTYVLLEQETWFEKEMAFLAAYLKPGMSVVDVGANVGVYALSMARRVGPQGHVFAFEPSSETRDRLVAGVKANGLANVTVLASAVSDQAGKAVLGHGASSELHALVANGPGEPVALTTLDNEDGAGRWQRIDFLKLDAEGAEGRILAAAHAFLKRHAPLVMFEVKAGTTVNSGLVDAFRALDFSVFRALPEAPLLVPSGAQTDLDGYELNLFAVPSDKVATLATSDVLITEQPAWEPSGSAIELARERLAASPFLDALKSLWLNLADVPEPYRAGLAGFATWRFGKQGWAVRYAALMHAVSAFSEHARSNANCATLSMLARALYEAGRRAHAVDTLLALAQRLAGGDTSMPVPFWPALPRLDSIAPGTQAATWLRVSALEQLERLTRFSSAFGGAVVDLAFLASEQLSHIEMERRRVLASARSGNIVDVPKRLWPIAPDHRNAEIWRHGLVPNTRRRVR